MGEKVNEHKGLYAVGVRFTSSPEETLAAWQKLLEDKLTRAGPKTTPKVDVVKL